MNYRDIQAFNKKRTLREEKSGLGAEIAAGMPALISAKKHIKK